MRTMRRNKQSFYEAKVTGVEMGQNGDGEYTEETKIYSTPDEHYAVISPASGSAELQEFGANEVYDKVITLEKGENYLAVGSLLWIDCPIELDTNGDLAIDENGKLKTPYNYIVTAVSESSNFVKVAIRKVSVS